MSSLGRGTFLGGFAIVGFLYFCLGAFGSSPGTVPGNDNETSIR